MTDSVPTPGGGPQDGSNQPPFTKKPWKRNLRKVPEAVIASLGGFPARIIVAAAVKRVPFADLAAGLYAHLGLSSGSDGQLISAGATQILPPAAAGRYSSYNVYGREVIRRDLPKVTKVFEMESPNFGDPDKGYHTTTFTREVYPRDFHAPRLLTIRVKPLPDASPTAGAVFPVLFRIDVPLDRDAPEFDADLLFHLNILQENVGAVGVSPSDATVEDYLKTLQVNWEVLPPGEKEEALATILGSFSTPPPPAVQATLVERYELLSGLDPDGYITGVSGFQRYFGARFGPELVVFENVRYGNAAYAILGDWQALSQMSRLQLLGSEYHGGGFVRFVHCAGWQKRLRRFIRDHRG